MIQKHQILENFLANNKIKNQYMKEEIKIKTIILNFYQNMVKKS